MIPDFRGYEVTAARIEYGLHLTTRDRWEFTLAEPVLVTTVDGDGVQQVEIDVDVEAQELPDALQDLEGAVIQQVLVSRDGDLGIQFAQRHLTVRASEDYEAWQIAQPGGERFISSPGGELTHFSAVLPRDDELEEDAGG